VAGRSERFAVSLFYWSLRRLLELLVLKRVLRESVAYYNTHRPHRSLDQQPPLPKMGPVPPVDHQWRVRRRDRLGGLLHEYELAA
jgi:putative transposase